MSDAEWIGAGRDDPRAHIVGIQMPIEGRMDSKGGCGGVGAVRKVGWGGDGV